MDRIVRRREQVALGALLKEARQGAGLRQSDLAARLSVPQSYVSKYECGDRVVSLLEVRRICQAMGLSVAMLLSGLEARLEDR